MTHIRRLALLGLIATTLSACLSEGNFGDSTEGRFLITHEGRGTLHWE